jgi:hypothetical protein
MNRFSLCATLWLLVSSALAADEIQHSFLACGSHTYIVDEAGAKTWTYPQATRDGYVLTNGNIVLAVNGNAQHPGGSVVEVAKDGSEKLLWAGTQSEVNSVQPTQRGTYVITEAGPKPRLLELERDGKILLEFPLKCQSENHHMETRMARQLSDGTFLVPHLLDFAVRHYDRTGQVLGSFDTTAANDPEHAIHTWPFTAIRHAGESTLVSCTNGNRVIDFDAHGNALVAADQRRSAWCVATRSVWCSSATQRQCGYRQLRGWGQRSPSTEADRSDAQQKSCLDLPRWRKPRHPSFSNPDHQWRAARGAAAEVSGLARSRELLGRGFELG